MDTKSWQQAADSMNLQSRDVIRMYLWQRLTNKATEVYLAHQQVFDKFLQTRNALSQPTLLKIAEKLIVIGESNLTAVDIANMKAVAQYCSAKSTGDMMTSLEIAIKIMFDDGLVYWERIASIMELTSFIIIQQPQHILLGDVLTWYFEHTTVNSNGDTIDRKVQASGGWICLLSEHNDLNRSYPNILQQNPPNVPSTVAGNNGDINADPLLSVVRKACACGEPVRQKFVKTVHCKKCKMYLCLFPGCDYICMNYSAVYTHWRSEHPSQGTKAINRETHCVCGKPKNRECGLSSMKCPSQGCPYIWCLIDRCSSNFTSMRKIVTHVNRLHENKSINPSSISPTPNTLSHQTSKRAICPCGEKIPFDVTKVFKCKKCRKQYICTYQGCNFTGSTCSKVKYHQSVQHAGQSWTARNRYTHCVCGELKNRDSGLTYMKCTNQECRYFWCLLDECEYERTRKDMLLAHMGTSHKDGGSVCGNCKLGTKIRDGQSTKGVCGNCDWRWCLVLNCNKEYDNEHSLMGHQTRYHKISRSDQS